MKSSMKKNQWKVCKEPGCPNTEEETPFWGDYCLFCALFHKRHKPNESQAYHNFIKDKKVWYTGMEECIYGKRN